MSEGRGGSESPGREDSRENYKYLHWPRLQRNADCGFEMRSMMIWEISKRHDSLLDRQRR